MDRNLPPRIKVLADTIGLFGGPRFHELAAKFRDRTNQLTPTAVSPVTPLVSRPLSTPRPATPQKPIPTVPDPQDPSDKIPDVDQKILDATMAKHPKRDKETREDYASRITPLVGMSVYGKRGLEKVFNKIKNTPRIRKEKKK
jgi:hypothetical protein